MAADRLRTCVEGLRRWHLAVEELDLAIADGELMVLVGPSGCGKTTALRMLAGLEEISEGTISIGDQVVNDLTPKERDIAMVFQNYALYPHMTVAENLAFGLKYRKLPKEEIREKVQEAAGRSRSTSTSTRSRARSPAASASASRWAVRSSASREAFLMDEPLSNLDAKLRVQMRGEIHDLQRRLGVTTVYVTHDQMEAMTLGDRVAVMQGGRLQQVATPEGLYERPRERVRRGLHRLAVDQHGRGRARALERWADGELRRSQPRRRRTLARATRARGYVGRKVLLGIRPEDIEDSGSRPTRRRPEDPNVCVLSESLGAEVLVYFEVEATGVVPVELDAGAEDGAAEHVPPTRRKTDGTSRFVARVSPRAPSAEGSPVELAVDTRRLYFFDPETGLAIWG